MALLFGPSLAGGFCASAPLAARTRAITATDNVRIVTSFRRRLHSKGSNVTPLQFRQALETLAFTDGSRLAMQLTSGQIISGHFQTMLTNGDMVWFTEERDAEER